MRIRPNLPCSTASLFLVLLLCFSAWAVAPVYGAGDQTGPETNEVVQKISFDGNRLLNDSVLRERFTVVEGDSLNRENLEAAVKALADLPFLSEASFTVEASGKVVIEVTERVKLDNIKVSGNDDMGQDDILEVASAAEDQVLEQYQVAQDVQAIEDLYAEEGYPFAQISWDVDITPGNKAILTFHAVEGPRCYVESIRFSGNASTPSEELKDEMESGTRSFPSFIWPGYLKRSTFREDLKRIEQYYWSQGYLDAEAAGHISHSQNMEEITLHITVYEGPQYKVDTISFKGNTVFRTDELRQRIPLSEGEPYNPEDVENSKQQIESLYHQQGYFDVSSNDESLQEELTYHPEKRRVGITFSVTEGKPAYIRRIQIEGLTKTKDEVVRRELTFHPGERADSKEFRESERRLRNTGYFDRRTREPVDISLEPGEDTLRDAVVKVKEGQTGSIFFGAGYSTESGVMGQATLRERNFDLFNWPDSWNDLVRGNAFRGGGHKLNIRLTAGTELSNASITFTNPHVWNSPYRLSTSAYSLSRVLDDYDMTRTGARVSVGRYLTRDVLVDITPGYEQIELDDVDDDTAAEIKRDEGSHDKPFLRLGMEIDRRDEPVIPSEGYIARAELEFAGADVETTKLTTSGTKFWTVLEPRGWGKHIFSLGGKMGIVADYGDRVPVFERFYAGGRNSMRGFDYYGVSPVDSITEEQIGGESMLIGSAEYSIPVVTDDFRLVGFIDAGYVEEDAGDLLSGWDKLRIGTGFGVRWRLPALGNSALAIDIGIPVKKEDFDDTRNFHLSLGGMGAF